MSKSWLCCMEPCELIMLVTFQKTLQKQRRTNWNVIATLVTVSFSRGRSFSRNLKITIELWIHNVSVAPKAFNAFGVVSTAFVFSLNFPNFLGHFRFEFIYYVPSIEVLRSVSIYSHKTSPLDRISSVMFSTIKISVLCKYYFLI